MSGRFLRECCSSLFLHLRLGLGFLLRVRVFLGLVNF